MPVACFAAVGESLGLRTLSERTVGTNRFPFENIQIDSMVDPALTYTHPTTVAVIFLLSNIAFPGCLTLTHILPHLLLRYLIYPICFR